MTDKGFHFGLAFGWGANQIEDQLKEFGIEGFDCEHWQKDADALGRLVVRSLIAPSLAMKARNRLTRKIEKALVSEGHMVARLEA